MKRLSLFALSLLFVFSLFAGGCGGAPNTSAPASVTSAPVSAPSTTSSTETSTPTPIPTSTPASSTIEPVSASASTPEPTTADTAIPQNFTSPLSVHVLDVGQADSILIKLPNDQTMLIDGGNRADSSTVISYLKTQGISRINYLLITHPHEDHIGGLPDIIKAVDVDKVYMTRATTTTNIFEELLDTIQSKGLTLIEAKAGVNMFTFPGLQADILAPVSNNYDDLNEWSAVVKIVYGETSFLLTGDAGKVSEAQITADVAADVLKVGHHGSETSTSEAFLKKVSPAHAIISVGADNSYGHPASTTLAALQAAGAAIYRTDTQGTIIVTSDGSSITVNTAPAPDMPSATPKATSARTAAPTAKTTSTPAHAPTTKATPTPTPTQKPTPTPTPTERQGAGLYVTETGTKYHRDGCRYLSRSKIPISLEDARASYEPCSVCDPPS